MQFIKCLPLYFWLTVVIFTTLVSCQSKITNSSTSLPATTQIPCPQGCFCDADSRVIDTLGSPQMVTCSNRNLSEIPDFSALVDQATTIDLSYNRIKIITLFDTIPELRVLNLSRNSIETIEPKAFEQIPKLEILDLTLNRLSSLPDMIFVKLGELKEIDLSENELTSIQENTFDNQQRLEILHLRANNLRRLPDNLFQNVDRLRILDLSHNSLYNLPDNIFHYTPALTVIDLSENQFSIVPPDLARATKLEELDISANMMKKLDHESFSNLGSLQVLRINNMRQLTEIDDYTFSYLCNLRHLEITFNPRLSLLAHSAFYGLFYNSSCFSLEEVNLYGNQLSDLKEHVLPVCKIPKVDLRDNQWKCDCHFRWIKSCKHNDSIHQQIKCTSPLQIANIAISSIEEDQFTCPNEASGYSREIRLFRLFVVLFGVLTLVFMGFMIIYYLHKAKVIRSFGNKYQRMGAIHYVKAQSNEVQE